MTHKPTCRHVLTRILSSCPSARRGRSASVHDQLVRARGAPLHTHRYARRCEETSGQPPLRAALRLGARPATQEEAERLSSECPVTVFGGEHLFGGCRECSGKEHELEGSSVSNPRASAKAGQVLAGGKGRLNQTVTGLMCLFGYRCRQQIRQLHLQNNPKPRPRPSPAPQAPRSGRAMVAAVSGSLAPRGFGASGPTPAAAAHCTHSDVAPRGCSVVLRHTEIKPASRPWPGPRDPPGRLSGHMGFLGVPFTPQLILSGSLALMVPWSE